MPPHPVCWRIAATRRSPGTRLGTAEYKAVSISMSASLWKKRKLRLTSRPLPGTRELCWWRCPRCRARPPRKLQSRACWPGNSPNTAPLSQYDAQPSLQSHSCVRLWKNVWSVQKSGSQKCTVHNAQQLLAGCQKEEQILRCWKWYRLGSLVHRCTMEASQYLWGQSSPKQKRISGNTLLKCLRNFFLCTSIVLWGLPAPCKVIHELGTLPWS